MAEYVGLGKFCALRVVRVFARSTVDLVAGGASGQGFQISCGQDPIMGQLPPVDSRLKYVPGECAQVGVYYRIDQP